MVMRSQIKGCGSYLPERIMYNDELATMVDTTDTWIKERSGISQRHLAAQGEFTSHLATKAAQRALDDAAMAADEIDLIIVATTTPDEVFPSTATRVQHGLGMTRGAAFDLQAVCSGFLFALAAADSLLRGGSGKTALVIGAETVSRILDWEDRGTCFLFGDGAGAVILSLGQGDGTLADRGVLDTCLHTDGRDHDCLYADGGPSSSGTIGKIRMIGQEVFKKAVVRLADVAREIIDKNNITADDIDFLVPHQANLRIMKGTAKKLGLPLEKLVVTIDKHANTSAASIPLALDAAYRRGDIKKGDLLLLEAIGGGMAWGSALLRW